MSIGTNEKNPMYGWSTPSHWFHAQLNSRACDRTSAPNALSSVVGTHSQPMSRIRNSFHQRSVPRRIIRRHQSPACATACIGAVRARCTSRRFAVAGSGGRIRRRLAQRTSRITMPRYAAKEMRKYAVLAHDQSAIDPSTQYSGPTAVHSAIHRQANPASPQRAPAASPASRTRRGCAATASV